MKFLKEITNRTQLIFISYIILINNIYSYKENLLYLILKILLTKNHTNYYFIYTNIFELCSIYINLIYFFSFNLTTLLVIHQIVSFINFGLYKNEYNRIKLVLIMLIILYFITFIFLIFFITPTVEFIVKTLHKQFVFNSIHLETKVSEYITTFSQLYKIVQAYITVLFFTSILISQCLKKNRLAKYRKLYQIICALLLFTIMTTINQTTVETFFNFLAFFILSWFYELYLIFLIYYNKIK